jgi:addiction module RelE/StbE family toxin
LKVLWTETAKKALRKIRKKNLQNAIVQEGDELAEAPWQGKELRDELVGYRSLHVARDRYRLIYRVDVPSRRILILLVGPRPAGEPVDVYAVAKRLIETGLL